MAPQILFALQAPTLLNNLAQIPDVWDVRWVEVGSVDFQEKELLDVPEWDGEVPVAFVGCSPDHERWAYDNLRGIPYLNLIHSSDPEHMNGNPSGKRCVTLQSRGAEVLRGAFDVSWTHVLSPAYECKPAWTWTSSCPWAVMSRPWARKPSTVARASFVQRSIPCLRMYGQVQPMGFLAGNSKSNQMAKSSCLVSMVDHTSGFGLMEHEAMVAGVPVVARVWGDMVEEAPGHPALANSDEELVTLARRCCTDKRFAEEVSAAGLDYIRRCRTLDRLRDSASELLRKISSTS